MREFAMIKPNAVRRGIVGEVISKLEKKGLKIIGMKLLKMTSSQSKELYKEHVGKDFYEKLIEFSLSGPVVALVIEGPRAIEITRHIVGKTDPLKAMPGSIRGTYGLSVRKNVIHASDSEKNAERELKIFFDENELLNYELDYENDL
ncbi:nucleoside-diphosphate kinase [Tepiditoga spiralis]|uniref:Nucleoside diphosphate kinase n=1 Tax=Tepiditoga spiralis TaxID=2108365 RepID=A0A7G1G8B7_9BACT|nr:nucleoside-diphosphate kinase [Tepiditoga spiralis]BBE31646.1 nucleoside-diphosphate kinase [Tepiditoga spiralis]